jgi:formylglycine-generating enzyme required for sulfatase activity
VPITPSEPQAQSSKKHQHPQSISRNPTIIAALVAAMIVATFIVQKPVVSTKANLPKTITNSVGMEFVLIPADTFTMGSPDSDKNAYNDEKPAHQVTISQPFYMGKYEVTQAQWKSIMSTNPSELKGNNHPVETVSWADVQQFIQKLNEQEKQAGGILCRLPTEAEWEYAARAGTTTHYSFGDNVAQLKAYAFTGGGAL